MSLCKQSAYTVCTRKHVQIMTFVYLDKCTEDLLKEDDAEYDGDDDEEGGLHGPVCCLVDLKVLPPWRWRGGGRRRRKRRRMKRPSVFSEEEKKET